MFRLLVLLILLSRFNDAGRVILAHQSFGASSFSASADLHTSTLIPSKLPYNSSQVTSSTDISGHQSLSLTIVPTPLPSPLDYDPAGLQNWQDLNSGSCAVDDEFCSYEGLNKTTGDASISAFADQCLLWDASCPGNRTLAMEEFFNSTKSGLQNNQCFSNFDSGNEGISLPEVPMGGGPVLEDTAPSSDCKTYNPSERISAWKKIKNWMRSEECVSARTEWVKEGGHMDTVNPEDSSNVSSSCCGDCCVVAVSVDLYYWPEPDINTSCLSIIGNSVRPYDYGATTMGPPDSEIYWACTAKTPLTSTWTSVNAGNVHITTTTISLITTAAVMSIGTLSIKVPLIYPWTSSPCVESNETPQGFNASNNSPQTIQARGHSLNVSSPITQSHGLPVSTIVMGDFTFTSPSVYANFHGIEASDWCGQTTLLSTMLSFSSGELSTIEGPYREYLTGSNYGGSVLPTKRFDFRDLPCPPQSIMEANWYKPKAGEPYRPLIAMPSQLKQSIPWFSFCQDIFTAYDPPTALRPATAFGPGPTPAEGAKVQPLTPVPSATLDPGARKTGKKSVPSHTNGPAVGQPKATIDPVPLSKLGNPSSGSSDAQKGSDGKQDSNPKQGSDPDQDTGTSDDPSQSSDVKQGSDTSGDPSQDTNAKGSDLQQGSGTNGDSSQGNDPKLSSDASADPGLKVDPNVPNNALIPTAAINGNQDSAQNGGSPVSENAKQNENSYADGGESKQETAADSLDKNVQATTHSDILNNPKDNNETPNLQIVPLTPLDSLERSQVTTINNDVGQRRSSDINLVVGAPTAPLTAKDSRSIITNIRGQAITAAPTAITIPDKILRPGDPSTILHGAIIALDKAGQLTVGSQTIPIPIGTNSPPLTTTVDGQVVIATPGAVTIAGTTLGPGSAGVSVDGTLLSLDTAGHLVVGSKTLTFESDSVGSDAAKTGSPGPDGPVVTATNQHKAANETGKGNDTVASVQAFKGNAEDLIAALGFGHLTGILVAVVLCVHV